MNSLNQSTMSFGSTISSRGGVGDDELETCSIISFGSHRSTSKSNSRPIHHQQSEIKVETVYSLLSMLTCNNIKEEMCNKFYSMSLDKRISLEMRGHGCIPLLIQLIHPIGEESVYLDEEEIRCNKNTSNGHEVDSFETGDGDDFQSKLNIDSGEEGYKELKIRNKACIALRNIVRYTEDTKAGKKEMRVLQLLEEIRGFCDKFKRGKGDLSVSMAHPGEATSHLMKISFDEEHRVAICLLGGLHAIAELIFFDTKYHGNTTSPQCITVRRYAFMALTNLTFGDGTNKSILCSNKKFIRSLIEQLNSPSEELRQVTASVLRNLSWKADDQGKDTLREMGAVRMLMRAALEARKESTLKSILTALWNLSAHSTTNKAEICAVEGALKFLVSSLNYQSPSNTMVIIENGGGILRNVSSYIARHEHLRAILRDHDTLSILLDQLQSPSLTIVSNACATLWNLSARCIQDQLKLIELGALTMLRNLVNSKHKMISMGSAAALKNLSSIKNYHELVDSSTSPISRTSSCTSPSTSSATPTLLARKSNGFRPELDESLSETCDNLESPKSSPAHVRRFHLPPPINRFDINDRMYNSFTVPTLTNPYPYMSKSSSKDSLDSTHSEPVYYPFNQGTHRLNQTTPIKQSQPIFESALPRSSSHGFAVQQPSTPSSVSATFTNDLSHIFHAHPIKVSNDLRESSTHQPSQSNSSSIEADSLDEKILDNARLNVENIISNGRFFTNSNLNSLGSGIKCSSYDNVTLNSKGCERPLLRRKLSADGCEWETFQRSQLGSMAIDLRSLQSPETINKATNRLTYSISRANGNERQINQCNQSEVTSNSNKKIKNDDTIEEESEESLRAEERLTIKTDQISEESSVQVPADRCVISTENCVTSSHEATPLMFSRTSSLGSISGLDIKSIGTSVSSVPSEFSKVASDPVSPTDLPDSPTDPVTFIQEVQKPHREKSSKPSFDTSIDSLANCFEQNSSQPNEALSTPITDTIDGSQLESLSLNVDQNQNQDTNTLNDLSQSQNDFTSNDLDNSNLPEASVSLYSLESHDINNIAPPSCIDEASLSLESSNFASLEFTDVHYNDTIDNTKPEPPKIVSTLPTVEARKLGVEAFLESTNPPSDMDVISGLSSSCGSLNSLESELGDSAVPRVKDFDPEAFKLIQKHTQDLIELTEFHKNGDDDSNPQTVPPKPLFQRNDTFTNYDGQNESEDDSRATYVCSPRRARIVKPVLRIQPNPINNSNNSFNRRITVNSPSSHSSNDSIASRNRSLVIKGTKTTALRVNRSKATSDTTNDPASNVSSSSVPTTPVKKVSSNVTNNLNTGTSFSSKTYVIRKKVASSSSANLPSDIEQNNAVNGMRNRSSSVNKMCNLNSNRNGSDKLTCQATSVHANPPTSLKRIPVQSKIASLWKRSNSEKENNVSSVPIKFENTLRSYKGPATTPPSGLSTPMSPSMHLSPSTPLTTLSSPTTTTSSLTRSSTYEKLPSSPGEAIKMQSSGQVTKDTKENGTYSRVPLTKNRIRPAQDQITVSLNKQSKVVRLETKRKQSLVT